MKRDIENKYKEIFDKMTPNSLDGISDVILFWDVKSGRYYHNCMTGEQVVVSEEIIASYDSKFEPTKEYISVLRSNANNLFVKRYAKNCRDCYAGFYTEYNEKFDAVVIYSCEFDTNSIVNHMKREWKYFKPIFLFTKDGEVLYNKDVYSWYQISPCMLNRYTDICQGQMTELFHHLHFSAHTSEAFQKLYGNGITTTSINEECFNVDILTHLR